MVWFSLTIFFLYKPSLWKCTFVAYMDSQGPDQLPTHTVQSGPFTESPDIVEYISLFKSWQNFTNLVPLSKALKEQDLSPDRIARLILHFVSGKF